MNQKHVARARRLVTRRWFLRLRLWKNARLFKKCDRKLLDATPYELDRLSEDLSRYAIKQAWYINKLKHKK